MPESRAERRARVAQKRADLKVKVAASYKEGFTIGMTKKIITGMALVEFARNHVAEQWSRQYEADPQGRSFLMEVLAEVSSEFMSPAHLAEAVREIIDANPECLAKLQAKIRADQERAARREDAVMGLVSLLAARQGLS